ncbi:MAG: MMPL family transporter [Hyphomicrobiaceae bacterium]|nr:MMPL family transporter [Hyphomicrobiaceae bacterium]
MHGVGGGKDDGSDAHDHGLNLGFGLDRLGLVTLAHPMMSAVAMLVLAAIAAMGLSALKVDDSLSELFRTETAEFRRYEEIDRRFPSSEYDVLVVVEGKDLLARPQLTAFRQAVVDLQLADGVNGVVSMLSARGRPDAKGYAAPIVPDTIPEGAVYEQVIRDLRSNEIVAGKFLSADGTLAMAVLSLDRETVVRDGARAIVGGIIDSLKKELAQSGLSVQVTGAPVMQLEIRNAVERDQMVYNGLGLAFGAAIALVFFRSLRMMLLAALPPVLAVVMSLGLLGWLGFKLNLFLNVMTPLVMVMGFADSMQMTYAIRDRLVAGDSARDAIAYAVRVVGPACVVAHATALVSFIALLFSDSALIRTFGQAGALATLVSFVAVIGAMPVLSLFVLGKSGASSVGDGNDRAMKSLARFVGHVVDWVTARPVAVSVAGLLLAGVFALVHSTLEPRYRLADQVPDREQALKATGRLDQKLTGANPVHVMIKWKDGQPLYEAKTLAVIAETHRVLETAAGLGNVWSLDSLRRWLKDAGDDGIVNVQRYVKLLPEHLVRRFIAKEETAVLVTGRLPDVDASQILPVVDKIDAALEPVRKANPGYEISVTGLPAIAARNSARLIKQLNEALWVAMALVAVLLGLAFRSVFVTVIALLPSLFPIVAAGTALKLGGEGLEFSSVIALVVIFGLGVDALIHFLNRLSREERVGEDPALAIRRARVLVGPAIILTTIVLAFGLGVTVFSDLPSLRLFGRVCSITLIASLFGDLVFLPATVALARRYWPVKAKA